MHKSFAGLLALLLLALSAVGIAQQRGVSVPVIVVFEEATDFSGFENSYRADDRAQDNPAAWNYQDRGVAGFVQDLERGDRKSTRLNSSHSQISYAVFCL